MFASQSNIYNYETAQAMNLITPASFGIWYVGCNGSANYGDGSDFSIPKHLRPSINLKSTIVIKSGSGTFEDPFVVG